MKLVVIDLTGLISVPTWDSYVYLLSLKSVANILLDIS